MTLLNILLQAETGMEAAGGNSAWSSIIMIVLIFVVFYFFLIRPQNKRQKEVQKFQDSLEVGRRVVTSGGIYGRVREVKDNIVLLEIADNVRIKVSKSMVFDAPENGTQAAPEKTEKKD